MSKTEYRTFLTENAFKDSTNLCKNMKRILEVIMSLLKDRISVSKKLANKSVKKNNQEKLVVQNTSIDIMYQVSFANQQFVFIFHM